MDPNLYNKRHGGLSLSELIDCLEENDVTGGDIYVTPPQDGEDTDVDTDLSDDEHFGNISHLGPAMLRVESEFVPEPAKEEADEYESDDDIPLATLFPNAIANSLENSEPSTSKKSKMDVSGNIWTHQKPDFQINKDCTRKNPPNEAYGKTTPLEFFYLFFNEELLTNLEQQTNLYAQQKNENLNMTRSELNVVFGGLLLSGYGKYRNKRMYWSNDNDVPKLLSESMRLNRFEMILRHIHLNDNAKIDKENKLYKLQPLIDKLNENFKKYGGLDENLSIDESMIPYHGKHFAKQYRVIHYILTPIYSSYCE